MSNLGNYNSIEEVYVSYPTGGVYGDYVTIVDTLYYWHPALGVWSLEYPIVEDVPGESDAGRTAEDAAHNLHHHDGDFSVGNNVTVGNDIRSKRVFTDELEVSSGVSLPKVHSVVVNSQEILGGKGVFDFLDTREVHNNFTIGIEDDITNLSVHYDDKFMLPSGNVEFLIYGYGSDGMVSASKDLMKITGTYTNAYVQGYFQYVAELPHPKVPAASNQEEPKNIYPLKNIVDLPFLKTQI